MRIRDLFIKYSSKIDLLDFELIVAHTINKSREFVLAYPEYKISKFKISRNGPGDRVCALVQPV